MAEMIFLPDRDGADRLSVGAGLARMEGTADEALAALGDRMALRETDARQNEADIAAWRGALAAALLLNLWEGVESRLRVLTLDEHASPLTAMAMAARPPRERNDPIRLLLLEKGGERRLLGMISRSQGLTLPAGTEDLGDLLPERVTWYDREAGRFLDPTLRLTERDSELLVRRIHLLRLSSPEVGSFVAGLVREAGRESQAVARSELASLERLFLRVKATQGMMDVPELTIDTYRYAVPADDPFFHCFTDAPSVPGGVPAAQRVYRWRGIPFAQSSAMIGLRDTNDPREASALDALAGEMALLDEHSRAWQRQTAERIRGWLKREARGNVFSPAAREAVGLRCEDLEEASHRLQETVALTWPWSDTPVAVRYLLRETLGEAFCFEGSPFPEKLTMLPDGAQWGDTALRASCRLGGDLYLPPISEALAACLDRAPEGQGFVPEQLYLLRDPDGGVTASYLLRGVGEAALTRRYAPEEIVTLEATPTVAVWPCAPFADADWKAYYVYLRGAGVGVRTMTEDGWTEWTPGKQGYVSGKVPRYPVCPVLVKDGVCLGALPNALPFLHPAGEAAAVAALDIGATGVTAMLRMGDASEPLAGPSYVRTLLSGPDGTMDFAEEFVPPADLHATAPTCALLSGDGEEPLTDGRRYEPVSLARAAACEQTLLSGSLLWRDDEAARRGRKALLRQRMLETALAARLAGASSVTWRLALPDGMGLSLREQWLALARASAEAVAEETGLPLTPGLRGVTWITSDMAAGVYLRESVPQGSFALLDVGGGKSAVRLWLNTMGRPVGGCALSGGMQALLVGFLAEHPALLTDDFDGCADESLRWDASLVAEQLRKAKTSLKQMERALFLMDALFELHGDAMAAHMNARFAQGRVTWMQALLLEYDALMLLLAGLALDQALDDPMLAHLLPEEATLCLTGRGWQPFFAMALGTNDELARFALAGMRATHPTRLLTVWQSPAPKLDAARGLCRASLLSDEAAEETTLPPLKAGESFATLTMRFLTLFRLTFPAACQRLHPQLFNAQGMLTVAGEAAVRHAASRRYGDGGDVPSALLAVLGDMRVIQGEEKSAPGNG